VNDLGFTSDRDAITVNRLEISKAGTADHIDIGATDLVFVTNGSMTADKTFGSMTRAAPFDRSGKSGAWTLWQTLAQGRPQFGNPAAFNSVIAESSWNSYTVTVKEPLFFELIEKFSGRPAGEGGLITFKDSNWLITISVFHQPFFLNQPEGAFVWWGYGLFHDRPGNYVQKSMLECTGAEILEEVLGHLHFEKADTDAIIAASNCIPCTMPYITSQFMVRTGEDRPKVIPKGSTNFAFLGQYTEQADDVVFTVEYSVRSAMTAVYTLFKLDKTPPPVYKGLHSPSVLVDAIRTMHR